LPKLRYHPLLGRGSQPGGLWSRSIRGLAYRRGWNTISRADHRLSESRAQLFDHHEQHLEIGLSQNLFEIISEDTRTDSFVAQRLDSLFMNQSISRISV